MFSPTVSVSVSDESDLVIGAILGIGDRPVTEQVGAGIEYVQIQSEYGTYPNMFFAELKYYF
jgi:hypothetical protein